jgi:TonB-dependent receptor
MVVTYVGYGELSEQITVSDGDNTINIALNVSYVEMDEVVVSGLRQGDAKALSMQKASDHIENIISAEQIERFPDPNAAEALRRLPGVSVQKDHGEGRYVLIRGTAARLNTTMINGERIPSPEDDNRNVSMDIIPSDLMGSIEVSKAITPDMDGDAIGGAVNLVTKGAFDYDKQVIKLDLSGGYRDLGGLGQKAGFTYANQLMGGKLGVLVGASYINNNMQTDNLEMEWLDEYEIVSDRIDWEESAELDDGDWDIDDEGDTTFVYEIDGTDGLALDAMELRFYKVQRQRIGLNLDLRYKLDDQSSVYLRVLNNVFTDMEYRHLLQADISGSVDEESPGTGYDSQTSVVGDVPLVRELKDRKSVSTIRSIAAGGNHVLGNLLLDYNLSTSFAEELRDPSKDIVFEYEVESLDFNIDDHKYPTYTLAAGDDDTDLSNFEFDESEVKSGEITYDKDLTGAVNLEYPFSIGPASGSIKLGGKYVSKEKESDKTNELIWGLKDDVELTAEDFDLALEGDEFHDGHYEHSVGIDPDAFNDYWDANRDANFESEPGLEAIFYETWQAAEKVTAGYGMATLNFGQLMVLAGARMEMTSTTYDGWEGDLIAAEDADDPLDVMSEIQGTKDYTHFLPMVHLRYNLNNKTVIRGAFTQTLARPDYVHLVPFKMFEDGDLESGNPDLEPTLSTNLDLMVEYYVGQLGLISGGFFTKTLTDYIYYKIEAPEGMLYGGEEVGEWVYPVNGEDATLSGFEIAWQQHLTFLPGPLSGLGIYLNYTSTTSEANYIFEERDPTTLPGQADHVGNFALSYEKAGFTGRLSANFHGQYIEEVGEDADEDVYYANNMQIDFSASYSLGKNMMIYADIMNLNNAPVEYYISDPENDLPIQRELYSFGARMGIKYEF